MSAMRGVLFRSILQDIRFRTYLYPHHSKAGRLAEDKLLYPVRKMRQSLRAGGYYSECGRRIYDKQKELERPIWMKIETQAITNSSERFGKELMDYYYYIIPHLENQVQTKYRFCD